MKKRAKRKHQGRVHCHTALNGHTRHCVSQGLGTRPPEATTVAAICSNWEPKLGESAEMLWGFFNIFRNSAGRGESFWRLVPFDFSLVEWGALGIARNFGTGLGAPAAGAPPPGSPPQMDTSGSQRRVVSAAHGRCGWGIPAVCGVGAAFWCPKWPVPLSRLFGGGLESHRNPLKSVGTASRWCEVGHRHTHRPSVREDIRANALGPPRTQNPGLKSP
jgi:hypothetical protein